MFDFIIQFHPFDQQFPTRGFLLFGKDNLNLVDHTSYHILSEVTIIATDVAINNIWIPNTVTIHSQHYLFILRRTVDLYVMCFLSPRARLHHLTPYLYN